MKERATNLQEVERLRNQDNLSTAEPDPCTRVLNCDTKSETAARIRAHKVLHAPNHLFNIL